MLFRITKAKPLSLSDSLTWTQSETFPMLILDKHPGLEYFLSDSRKISERKREKEGKKKKRRSERERKKEKVESEKIILHREEEARLDGSIQEPSYFIGSTKLP